MLLDRLPSAYAAAFPFLMALLLSEHAPASPIEPGDWIGLGLSLWTCLFFAVVVAHELIHPAETSAPRLAPGRCSGVPLFAHEHLSHHGTSGNVDLAEWPRKDESVWSFIVRRTVRIVRSARVQRAARCPRPLPSDGGLAEAIAATAGISLRSAWLQAWPASCSTCASPPASTSAFKRSPTCSTGGSAWTASMVRTRAATHGKTAASSKSG